MMLWIVMGRPTTLPVKMFASLPLDAVIDSYDRTDDDMLSFKANGQRHAYTLTWPRYEGPYEALCWRHDQPLQRGKEKTCRGSFPEVMDAIRKWTYAELTRQGRDKAGSGQGTRRLSVTLPFPS